MRRDCIATIPYIVKCAFFYITFFYKILAHPVNIVTMIDVSEVIYLFQSFLTKFIDYI